MMSPVELHRIFAEWRVRLGRVKDILQPPVWSEKEWRQFSQALALLVRDHGQSWIIDPNVYWDMRWKLQEGGELVCQIEHIPGQKTSLVVAQNGGFAEAVGTYTWLWAEFNMEGNFARDPYWVEGSWREALTTFLMPFDRQAGFLLAGRAQTPDNLLLQDGARPNDRQAVALLPGISEQNGAVFTASEEKKTINLARDAAAEKPAEKAPEKAAEPAKSAIGPGVPAGAEPKSETGQKTEEKAQEKHAISAAFFKTAGKKAEKVEKVGKEEKSGSPEPKAEKEQKVEKQEKPAAAAGASIAAGAKVEKEEKAAVGATGAAAPGPVAAGASAGPGAVAVTTAGAAASGASPEKAAPGAESARVDTATPFAIRWGMSLKLTWKDTDDIAYALIDSYPDQDPLKLSFPKLHKMVIELEDFEDEPEKSSESILEGIQMAWYEEVK
jgi:FeS assembly protein IscX